MEARYARRPPQRSADAHPAAPLPLGP